MSTSADDPFTTFDAAYVLGALSPEDRAAFEQHLRQCDDCSLSVRELAGLPGLLSQVTPDMVAVEAPPPELLPALLETTRKSRRRRMFSTIGAAAVAAATCVAMVVSLLVSSGDDEVVPGGTAMTPLGQFPVEASARLGTAPGGGAQIDMSCSYYGGKGGDYVLVAVRPGGATEELATWRAIPADTARISVGTGMRPVDIQALEVRTGNGKPLLRWNP